MSATRLVVLLFSLFLAGFSTTVTADSSAPDISKLLLPPGFELEVLVDNVPNARQMALSDTGVLYVGTRRKGDVYAVTGWQSDASPAGLASVEPVVHTIASGLSMPSGLAFRDGSLYVGALDRILMFENIDARLDLPGDPKVITDALPDKEHHGWKYLSFGPDGALYVPVGAPCNICKSDDPRFASILRMDPESGETTLYAEGIRNTVGLAWHPENGNLYFSDNGRDMLGDDVPAEEINRVTQPGKHYGYPYIHAGDVVDPKFGKNRKAAEFEAPLLKIQAHSAALGIDFYTGSTFPERYRNAFETPDGPQYAPFISGWLRDEANWGRPNDVLVTPQGDLLISDDQTGSIYRVRYADIQLGAAGN